MVTISDRLSMSHSTFSGPLLYLAELLLGIKDILCMDHTCSCPLKLQPGGFYRHIPLLEQRYRLTTCQVPQPIGAMETPQSESFVYLGLILH